MSNKSLADILSIMRSEPLYNPHGDPALVEANKVLKNYADRLEAAHKRVTDVLERKVEFYESRANQYFHGAQEAKKFLAELLYYSLEDYDEDIASTAFVGCVKDSCATLGISYSPHGRDMAVPVQEYLNDSYAKPKKFDEAAFDAAVSKPNGWSEVADPVAEVRHMRGYEQAGNAAKLREALKASRDYFVALRESVPGTLSEQYLTQRIADIDAALAAPPRNCDVFSSESERQAAFIAYYNEAFDLKDSKYAIDTCDLKHDVDGILHDYIEWLFAPAKPETKGEGNGSK